MSDRNKLGNQTDDRGEASVLVNRLLTVPRLCEYADVKPSWVYEAVRSKGLPAFKLGNHLRFDPERVDAWLEANRKNDQ